MFRHNKIKMDDELVHYSLDSFYKLYDKETTDDRLAKKMEDILHEPKTPTGFERRPSLTLKPKKKFHMLSMDFTIEGENKKALKSLLNKLTDTNKDVICEKLKNNIKDVQIFFDMCISFIQQDRKTVPIYIDVLRINIDQPELDRMVVHYFEMYKKNKDWILPSSFKDINVYSNECDYDEYCRFSKWKTSSLCLIDFWNMYNDKLICCELADLLMDTLEANIHGKRQDIDTILEQIDILYEYIDLSRFKSLDYTSKEKSTYFKIKAILERSDKK